MVYILNAYNPPNGAWDEYTQAMGRIKDWLRFESRAGPQQRNRVSRISIVCPIAILSVYWVHQSVLQMYTISSRYICISS